jgi:methylthioribulose 1-phosphate dehydratase/enolase-phosphatase E1
MATILDPEASEFKVTHLEMIKVQIFLIPCKLKNLTCNELTIFIWTYGRKRGTEGWDFRGIEGHSVVQGIEGHGFYGSCVVPIIENTARECELTDRLRQAIKDYPQTNAVLVRRHGEYNRISSLKRADMTG